MAINLSDVLTNPASVADELSSLECVESAYVQSCTQERIGLMVTLAPHDPTATFIAEGFPVETVLIVVHAAGSVRAVPKSGRGRRWKHRNGRVGVWLDLCLWDPHDPVALRWTWDDGLEEYVRTVSRHLIYEECWRRTGDWPVEDAPHGDPPGSRWPLRTSSMRRLLAKWRHG